jgi:hypothetical protein
VRVPTTERTCFVLRKALIGSITSSNPFGSMNLRWTLHRRAAESIGVGAQVHGEFSPAFRRSEGGRLSATVSPCHYSYCIDRSGWEKSPEIKKGCRCQIDCAIVCTTFFV